MIIVHLLDLGIQQEQIVLSLLQSDLEYLGWGTVALWRDEVVQGSQRVHLSSNPKDPLVVYFNVVSARVHKDVLHQADIVMILISLLFERDRL